MYQYLQSQLPSSTAFITDRGTPDLLEKLVHEEKVHFVRCITALFRLQTSEIASVTDTVIWLIKNGIEEVVYEMFEKTSTVRHYIGI